MDQITARLEALRLASSNAHAERVEETVERAQLYYEFLMRSATTNPELKVAA